MKKQSTPLRILHIVTIMNRGGLETMLMNYYRNVDRDKIQFDFVVHRPEEGAFDEEIKKMGGRIYHLSPISFKNISQYIDDFSSFLSKHPEYRIIHSHLDSLSALPLYVAKKMKIPVRIAHSHTSSFDKNLKYWVRMSTKRLIRFYATDFFGCSKDAIRFMFGKVKKYTIVNNAIDVVAFGYNERLRNEMRKELGIGDNLVIGHVGRFNYPKNHDFLIDVFNEIHKKEENAVLLLVGDGEERVRIQEKVQKLGIADSVIFLGVRSDVARLMQAMDAFVMPSHYEGLPVVSIEAQIAGLECFFSDVITRDLAVTDRAYFIGLSAPLSTWVTDILDKNYHSDEHRLRNSSKNYIDFNIAHEAKKLEALYEKNYK